MNYQVDKRGCLPSFLYPRSAHYDNRLQKIAEKIKSEETFEKSITPILKGMKSNGIITERADISGGTSTCKLKLSVVEASDLSAQVKKSIARKLQADILILTHASDACVAYQWLQLPNLHQIS